MEKKSQHYEFEGVVLDIPLWYDELTGRYFEEYPDFMENPVWTKDGHPVMDCVEDACPYSEWNGEGRCMDFGSCIYYTPIAPHTLMGVCRHIKRRWAGKRKKTQDEAKASDETSAADRLEVPDVQEVLEELEKLDEKERCG